MRNVRYILFICLFVLVSVGNVYANQEETDYEFILSEYLGYTYQGGDYDNASEINDIIEVDGNYVMLVDQNKIFVYNEDAIRTKSFALNGEGHRFLTIDDKIYIIYTEYNSSDSSYYLGMMELSEDLEIGTPIEIEVIRDESVIQLSSRPYVYFDMQYENDEYLYYYVNTWKDEDVQTFLKIKKDLTSAELITTDYMSTDEKKIISDVAHAYANGTVLSKYKGGVVYYVSGDKNIIYYKDGSPVWNAVLEDVLYIKDGIEYNGNLLLSIAKENDDVASSWLVTINEHGKIIMETEITERFESIFNDDYIDAATIWSSLKLYNFKSGFFIVGHMSLTDCSEDEVIKLRASREYYYNFLLYYRNTNPIPEVKEEKVPETTDNIMTYVGMLIGSTVIFGSIFRRRSLV